MLTDREITTILDSGSDLEATVWMLIEAANAAGGIIQEHGDPAGFEIEPAELSAYRIDLLAGVVRVVAEVGVVVARGVAPRGPLSEDDLVGVCRHLLSTWVTRFPIKWR